MSQDGVPMKAIALMVGFIRDLHLYYPSYTQEELASEVCSLVGYPSDYDLALSLVKFTFEYLQKVEDLQA